MTENENSWSKSLHPETLRTNLTNIVIFVMAFETFRDVVISKLKYFFADSYTTDGLETGNEYKSEVSRRHRNELQASLLWFKENGAIDKDDMQVFQKIRKYRNELVHELAEFLTNAEREYDPRMFSQLLNLISKIDIWWFENIEKGIAPIDSYDNADTSKVISGTRLIIQLISDIALGVEPHEGYYYEQFCKIRT